MQSLRYHVKRPGFGLVQQAPTIVSLLIQRAFHSVRLPLHWSENVQEAGLSPANHKIELAGKPEVICPEVQRRVSEGRRTGQEVRYHCIAGLGVQSKDLMFSISKNPQASMAEVLAKAEKYINSEEALISKKESSSTHKERSRTDKQQGRSPKRQRNRERSPKKDRERSPKRRMGVRDHLGPPQPVLRRRYSPQRFTPLTATVSQVLREVQHE